MRKAVQVDLHRGMLHENLLPERVGTSHTGVGLNSEADMHVAGDGDNMVAAFGGCFEVLKQHLIDYPTA